MFVDYKSRCMVWNRLLALGMLRLSIYFIILVSNIVNLIIVFMYYMLTMILWFSTYMLMKSQLEIIFYLILGLKRQLAVTFEMKDLGILHYFLGLQVFSLSDGVFISHSKYALDILNHFKMDGCKPSSPHFQWSVKLTKEPSSLKVDPTLYQHLVDSLIHYTRNYLDISFVVSVVSWFMQDLWYLH